MGLFGSLKLKPSAQRSQQQQQYQPPPGLPPQQQQQQQQQYYAPPPGPPPFQSQPARQPSNAGRPSNREGAHTFPWRPAAEVANDVDLSSTFRSACKSCKVRHTLLDPEPTYDNATREMFWDELGAALSTVIGRACQYDSDGVDVSFFNNRTVATSHSAQELLNLFRTVEPRKSTPSASALRRVLDPYMDNLRNWEMEGKPVGAPRPKPLNLVVLTDGAPDRGENPEMVIVDVARRLDQADHLRALDDDLKTKHGIRDCVDTTLFDTRVRFVLSSPESLVPLKLISVPSFQNGVLGEQYILKALLGGINRQLDKQTI
ncbi:hypothetical protein P7C70_g6880, partial [Phenoliferia sp. Uapishka_3]